MSDIDDFIHGSRGAPSAKFPAVGTVVKGAIATKPEVSQRRDIDGNLMTWDDGNPRMQLVITLQTDERDPDVEDDVGLRRIFAPRPSNLLAAIADALKKSGARLEPGGTLAVKFTGEKPHERKGYNAIKEYVAQYQPPAGPSGDDLLGAASVLAAPAAAPAPDLVGATSSTDLF